MTIANNLRKMLHRKSAEYCCPNPVGNTVAGSFITSDKCNVIPGHDIAFYVGGASAIWNYNADQDGWIQLPPSGIAGTFGAGACGCFNPLSVNAVGSTIHSVSAGSINSIAPSGYALVRNLSGCKIRVVAGAGMGYEGTVESNSHGFGCRIYVTPASPVAFDSTTKYQLWAGSLWFMNAGSGAVGFSVYDRGSNSWASRSVTNLPTTWGTDGQLICTPSVYSGDVGNLGVGGNGQAPVTAATSTTVTATVPTVASDGMWVNYQLRVVAGTGKGQVRTITANTGLSSVTFTVSPAFDVTPDATSFIIVEGNDNFLYLLGNNAVTMYKYTISTNSWAVVSPAVARAGNLGAGGMADWIFGVPDSDWVDGTWGSLSANLGTSKQNGRYIYSIRGGTGNYLDIYDIAANTWLAVNANYGNYTETFTTGSCSCYLNGMIYMQKDVTGRIYRFNVAKNVLEPFVYNPVPQGAAVVGRKMFATSFVEDGVELNFLYTLGNTRSELTRWLII